MERGRRRIEEGVQIGGVGNYSPVGTLLYKVLLHGEPLTYI
jgi:hypothetical protein